LSYSALEASTKSVPTIGPVQEKDTIAKAINKIPTIPPLSFTIDFISPGIRQHNFKCKKEEAKQPKAQRK
jgi:hypothetical protein